VARAALAVPIALAALEVSHPAWTDGAVAQAVTAAGAWWIPLHLLLIVGYGLLALVLWHEIGREAGGRFRRAARALLAIFTLCNSAYLAVDGIAVGVLAQTDPNAADTLWNSPLVTVLADASGATWAAALIVKGLALQGMARGRGDTAGALVTWLVSVASAAPLAGVAALSRIAALATGARAVYQRGTSGMPFALLVFAAVLRQHVGAEAALGLVCVALALAITTRSAPAAWCPP
jgi:hypothetical protein